jgi:hypothetical protein
MIPETRFCVSLTLEGRAIGGARYRAGQHPGGRRCRPVVVAMTATDHPGQHPRWLLFFAEMA